MTSADFYARALHLPERRDRALHFMEHIEPTLNAAGFDIKLHTSTNTRNPRYNREPYEKMYRRTPGAIGCMLGQMEIIGIAGAVKKHAFVNEDDIIICKDFAERLKIIFEFLDKIDWHVFWLGGTVHINPPYWHTRDHANLPECDCTLKRDAELTDHPNILRSYGSFSTHSYFVNKKYAAKILSWLNKFTPHTIGIDYSFIALAPMMKNYVFVPGCIIQKDNRSSIGNGITEFSNFKSLGPHWYQERLTDFDPATYNWNEAKIKTNE